MASEGKPPDVPKAPRKRRRAVVQAIFGLGLDGKDGHTRITKGKNFVLFGGSSETHERMQEFTVRLEERMKNEGKRFGDVTPRELRNLARDL